MSESDKSMISTSMQCNCKKSEFRAKLREQAGEFERIVGFRAGYVCPLSGGQSHGKHGMEICFAVVKKDQAVAFLLFTGWLPTWEPYQKFDYPLTPAGIEFHSSKPRHEGHQPTGDDCLFIGSPCYMDTGFTLGDPAFRVLVQDGEEALFRHLEQLL